MAETVDRFFLRLPEGLRQTLKRIAKKNRRSLNAEIVARMERSLAGLHKSDLDDEVRHASIRESFGEKDRVEHLDNC
ncbi:Arc family DNA-binding protein [Pseudomonas chlororaphis]|uniref:Arc family DNA-binding protein n=1 Tax=Pseudomonas chlororaphis TaxID=587753 RepID=UPI00167B6B02|nr:Arc family DNA-binding protein [Pseudomonas chlororaphis]